MPNIFGQLLDESVSFLEDVGQDVLDSVDARVAERLETGTGKVLEFGAQQPQVQKAATAFAFDKIVVPVLLIAAVILVLK